MTDTIEVLDRSGAVVTVMTNDALATRLDSLKSQLDDLTANTLLFRAVDGEQVTALDTPSLSSELAAGRVWIKANVAFHIHVGPAPEASVSTSPPLSAGADYYLSVDDGDMISVVKAAGESDGTVWVSTENPIP